MEKVMSKLQKYCLVDYLVFTKSDDLFINEAIGPKMSSYYLRT